MDNFDISASYVRWPADIVYSGVALAKTWDSFGTLGFHVAGLQLGDMRVRTIYNPQGDGQMFTASQFSAGFSFSRFLTERFSAGLTIKYIQEDIWDYVAKNWAIDIGTYYDTGYHSLVLGMSILNFGPEMQFIGDYIDYSDPDEEKESGDFESHAIYWHRLGSDLSFPFSPEPFDESRFTKIDLPDPRESALQRATLTWRFSRAIRKWWNPGQ